MLISVTQVLLPLISYPYITRVLGPGNLGRINYVDFLSQLFIIFAAFGVPFYAVREISRVRYDKAARAKLVKEMILIQTIFSTAATIFFILVTLRNWQNNTTLYILAIINIFSSAFSFDWYIQGMEDFRFSAIRTLLIRVVMLAAFFIFIKQSGDYLIYPSIFSAGFIAIAVINGSKVISENHFTKQSLNMRQHLKPLWHFFLTSSAISIYVFFDTVILQHLTHNNIVVGYYTTDLKLVKICQVAVLTIGTVLMPRMSYLVSTGNITEIKKHLNKLLHFIITFGIPAGAGIYLLAPEIILVVAGKEFLPAIGALRILAFLPFIIGLSNIFSFQCLVPFKKEKQFLVAVIIGSIISLSLNFILIPQLQERGAAYANLITETVITVVTGYFAYKLIRITVSGFVGTLLSTLVFIPVIILLRSIFSNQFAILFSAILSCSSIYIFIQHIFFKNDTIIELKNYLSDILNTKKNAPAEF